MSLAGDLIMLQTCICRPLLLIHLYAALLITKTQTFERLYLLCLYCMDVSTCEVLVNSCFFSFCECKKAAFPLVVHESFAMTGAASVMCLCLRLKCKSAHHLTACYQLFIVKHSTVDSSLPRICMFTKWVQVLSCTAELQQLHL